MAVGLIAKCLWWVGTCLICLMIGANTASCFYVYRKDHKIEFKNQCLRAEFEVNKELTRAQARKIKRLEAENAKLKKTDSSNR